MLFIFNVSVYGATPSTHKIYTTLGEQLERNLFEKVKEKDWDAVKAMIAPDAQSINADKIRNRRALITYIESLKFKNYRLSNFTVTKIPTENTLVVTYDVTYEETVAGKPESGVTVKNLSVWDKINGRWQWIAHAVID